VAIPCGGHAVFQLINDEFKIIRIIIILNGKGEKKNEFGGKFRKAGREQFIQCSDWSELVTGTSWSGLVTGKAAVFMKLAAVTVH